MRYVYESSKSVTMYALSPVALNVCAFYLPWHRSTDILHPGRDLLEQLPEIRSSISCHRIPSFCRVPARIWYDRTPVRGTMEAGITITPSTTANSDIVQGVATGGVDERIEETKNREPR